MALPITSTPPLNAKEARKFFRSIEKDLKKPSEEIRMPDLKLAEIRILKHALEEKNLTTTS